MTQDNLEDDINRVANAIGDTVISRAEPDSKGAIANRLCHRRKNTAKRLADCATPEVVYIRSGLHNQLIIMEALEKLLCEK